MPSHFVVYTLINLYEIGEKWMISLQIADVKQFMLKLLTGTVFDHFYVMKYQIQSFCDFSLDGKINKDFFSTDEQEMLQERSYVKWKEVRQFAFQIIKGNKTPLFFHIVFILPPDETRNVVKSCKGILNSDEIAGLYLNIHFENGILTVVTGSSVKNFTLDKTLDLEWEESVKLFLKNNEIIYNL